VFIYIVKKTTGVNKKTFGKNAKIKKLNIILKRLAKIVLEKKEIDYIYKVCLSDFFKDKMKRLSKSFVPITNLMISNIKHL